MIVRIFENDQLINSNAGIFQEYIYFLYQYERDQYLNNNDYSV